MTAKNQKALMQWDITRADRTWLPRSKSSLPNRIPGRKLYATKRIYIAAVIA